MALTALIAVLLASSAWLYVRNGDSFLPISNSSSAPHPSHATRRPPRGHGGSGRSSVTFAGSSSATELPCSIRQDDVRKVLAYLAATGERSRADLAAVCRYYGARAVSVSTTS